MVAPDPRGSRAPVISWLGDPPPAAVAASLSTLVRVHRGWTPEARLVAVWAPSDPAVLSAVPVGPDRPPVIVATPTDPDPAQRRRWLQAGADDLVAASALPLAVARRLRSAQRTPPAAPPPEPAPPATTSALELDHRAFPPLTPPRSPGGQAPEIDAWASAMRRYMGQREHLVRQLGQDGLSRLLELTHLRAQVPTAAEGHTADRTFGRTHGESNTALQWPVLVRRGPSQSRPQVAVSEAIIQGVGTDGLQLSLGFRASPRQRLIIDLALDERRSAQLLVEARWQRRTASRRWMLGALIIDMQLVEG